MSHNLVNLLTESFCIDEVKDEKIVLKINIHYPLSLLKTTNTLTRNWIRHGDELGGLFSILWSLKSQKRKKNEEKKLMETPGLEPGTSRSLVKCVTDIPKHFP